MTSPVHTDDHPRAIGRRRLVRTAAWTVPAISIATAVPAFAASGCCDVSLTGTAGWRTGSLNYLDIPVTIANGCSSTLSGLTLALTICGVSDLTYADTTNLPSGWTQLGEGNKPLSADGNGCYTLTFMTPMTLGPNASTSVTFTAKSKAVHGPNRPGGTVTAFVSTTGCQGAPVAISLAAV